MIFYHINVAIAVIFALNVLWNSDKEPRIIKWIGSIAFGMLFLNAIVRIFGD